MKTLTQAKPMIKDIALMYVIAFAYIAIWTMVKSKSKVLQNSILILSFVALFIIGYSLVNSNFYSEITSIGNGLLYLSPIVLLGPVLNFTAFENRSKLLKSILYLLLPFLGVLAVLILLVLTSQISGV